MTGFIDTANAGTPSIDRAPDLSRSNTSASFGSVGTSIFTVTRTARPPPRHAGHTVNPVYPHAPHPSPSSLHRVHEHAVRPVPSHLGHSSRSASSPPPFIVIAPYAAKITPHVAACSTHHDVSNACGNAARSTRRAVDPPLARAFPRPRIRRPPSSSSLARVTARATPVLTQRVDRPSRVAPRVARARAVVAVAVVTVDMTPTVVE